MKWIKEFVKWCDSDCSCWQGITEVKDVTHYANPITAWHLHNYMMMKQVTKSLRAECLLITFLRVVEQFCQILGLKPFSGTSRTFAEDKLLITFSWFLTEEIRFTFGIEWRCKFVDLLKCVNYRKLNHGQDSRCNTFLLHWGCMCEISFVCRRRLQNLQKDLEKGWML